MITNKSMRYFNINKLWHGIDDRLRKPPDKCSVVMHNEIIRVFKDGQRVQVGALIHGYHDELLKFLH